MANASVKRAIVAITQNQRRPGQISGALQVLFATMVKFANLGMAMAAPLRDSVSIVAVHSIKRLTL